MVGRIPRTAARRRVVDRARIVVIRPDGSSVLLRTPRRTLWLGATVAVLGAIALGAMVNDWLTLRRLHVDSATFSRRLAAEAQENARLRANLAAVRREMESWPKLAAAIGQPFDRSPVNQPSGATTEGGDDILRNVRHGTATLRETATLIGRLRDTVAALPARWPVRAAINSHFGVRRSPYTAQPEFHRGIDIAAAHGSPVHAPAPGAVVFAGRDGGYGLAVKVQHGDDIQTRYGHLSHVSVREGERVERGALLGRAGSTGRSTGAHLHYEVLVSGRAVNPKAFLWD